MIQYVRDILDKKIQTSTLSKEKEKLEIIKKILEDDNCFFKMDSGIALSILFDLGLSKEESKKIYKELLSGKYYNKKEA